jgi:hypothetical protein
VAASLALLLSQTCGVALTIELVARGRIHREHRPEESARTWPQQLWLEILHRPLHIHSRRR